MSFTLEDLGLAYRKAKVDLYYSTTPSLLSIASYEENLEANLNHLKYRLNRKPKDWVLEPEFLGSWALEPKSINSAKSDKNIGLVFASLDDEWQEMLEAGNKPTAEFRLMARCSIDFHVLSALWMLKVGALFDKKLNTSVYGSRLCRDRNGQINERALGSFKPYLKPFRDWRDAGINTMRSALVDKKKVLALTADVSSFFHELNPSFMLDEVFLESIGVNLDPMQMKLHRLFIAALQEWAKKTPLKKGLPVGLPASAVVANTALFKLDQFIEQQVVPLYYGRYVDDIMLVIDNPSNIRTIDNFWDWIFKRKAAREILVRERSDDPKQETILFQPDYLRRSN
ncbi:TPA: RNA-directed DNA polymerase, partial [Klebsiella pneumoniae]|nr:RNA-directed DNA polymerase [Klebsiella pneumoniae]